MGGDFMGVSLSSLENTVSNCFINLAMLACDAEFVCTARSCFSSHPSSMRSCQLIRLSRVFPDTRAVISVVLPVVGYVALKMHVPTMFISLPFAASIRHELSVVILKPASCTTLCGRTVCSAPVSGMHQCCTGLAPGWSSHNCTGGVGLLPLAVRAELRTTKSRLGCS